MRQGLARMSICVALLAAGGATPCRGDEAAAVAETTQTQPERGQLMARAKALDAEGKQAEVIEVVRQIVALDESRLGRNHSNTAASYDALAKRLEKHEQFGDAIEARAAQLEILTAIHGAEDWRVAYARAALASSRKKGELTADEVRELAAADKNNELGAKLFGEGKLKDAILPARQCLAIHIKILGEDNLETATSASNLGVLLESLGDYAAARPYAEKALAIRRKVLGEEHPVTAASLNNMGVLLKSMGDYTTARPYCEQALAIRRKVLGEEHIDTARSLYNLGVLLGYLGDKSAAQPCYEQSLAIKRKLLGDDHPDTAASMSGLANLLQSMGDYASARTNYEQALEIYRKVLGEEHPQTATALNNLGFLLTSMGDYAAARPYYEQSLAVRKKVLGENHPHTAQSLNNLGFLLDATGDAAAARPYYERALAIYKKVLGEEHPDTARSLNNLAVLLSSTGDYDAARPYYEQALAIRKKVLGEDHPEVAQSLNSFGMLLHSMGDYAAARPYYEEALAIDKAVLGEHHLDTAKTRGNLAVLSAAEGNWPAAVDSLVEAAQSQQHSLESVFSTSTETRMRTYLETVSANLDILLSMPLDKVQREADGLTWVLRRKAIVFEALCLSRAAQWLAGEDPEFAERQTALLVAKKQLDDVTLRPPAAVAPEELARRREALQTQFAQLQDELQTALSAHLGKDWSLMTTIESVRSELPADAALAEIVKYVPFNFQATGKEPSWAAERYVAFVLHADAQRPIELVELGEAAAIDEAVAALGQHQKDVQRAGEFADWTALETEYRGLAAPLYEKLFAPIAAKLAGVKRVYLSPDSQLHNLPFEALVDGSGKYLVEAGYQFAYVNSGRDLVRERSEESGAGVYVFAGPNYDLAADLRIAAVKRLGGERTTALAANTNADSQILVATSAPILRSAGTRIGWKHLPGADLEGQEAGAAFADAGWGEVHTYTGDDALEDLVKTVRRPKALVLVTHGDFLEDQPELLAHPGDSRSFAALDFESGFSDTRGGSGQARARLRATEDPMLRSYLLLAGANEIDEPFPAGTNLDNGWLTAQEISQLDLRGTDLVVLSACNTGRGRAENGQAVAGMRSAFLFAGARTIVGSLHEVPNAETRQLLKPFYEGVAAGRGKLASLNAAKLDFIRKRREETGAAHPFYWASFVLVGER